MGAIDAVGLREMDEETLPVMLSVCDTRGLEDSVEPYPDRVLCGVSVAPPPLALGVPKGTLGVIESELEADASVE